jgi:hypothetical protein
MRGSVVVIYGRSLTSFEMTATYLDLIPSGKLCDDNQQKLVIVMLSKAKHLA